MTATSFPSPPHLLHPHHHPTGNGDLPPDADRNQLAQAATLPSQLGAFGPISPPPMRRQPPALPIPNRIERFATLSLKTVPTPGLVSGKVTSERPMPSPAFSAGPGLAMNMPSQSTPPRPATQPAPATEAATVHGMTPKAQTEASVEWTMDKIVNQLQTWRQDIRERHSLLTGYILESTKPTDRRIHEGADLFANIRTPAVTEKKENTMRVKFKQHLKAKRDQREAHYVPICTKTNKDRVPSYRFHHVEIKKNILTPNTMLTFVPHLRDLEISEETKYNLWLKELEDIDLKSGFKPMNREDKQQLTIQGERAATVSLYLDTWLESLAMPGCTKSALISYMAACEPNNAITPRQKSDILHSQGVENTTPGANKAAKMFTDAFRRVFRDNLPAPKQIDLRRVLMLDESVDNIMDSKPIVKDVASLDATGPHGFHDDEDEDELAETNLATYCILGCLICYSHSCDHGEYDNKNMKRTFSISSCSHLSDVLKARRKGRASDAVTNKICRRRCYRRSADHVRMHLHPRTWSDDERIVLRSLFTTASHSSFKGDPICLAAEFLDRSCDEVFAEFKSLGVRLPQPEPSELRRVKNLSWYDRRRKVLLGDWQDHTITHAHQRRENLEPCSHNGPCAPRLCSCVDAGVLCEKFCGCSVEDCAYKFTGCACHSQGQTCQQNKKDKPCICVQLNRECDPQLCGSCGVLERADPLNADDSELHATGCRNCDLQRGVGKSLLLGQSQLEGCGYGLFTAEDIAQDHFIIEYVGELITHDEGVRREARRGDVFDEKSNVSYVFTLLENEGIWVDAAIYGNLSRYINHASEHDTRGCNITPRILYVNGEYRIKFTAMRDIKAGEELFFNYGENFPNLTKKLLDDKAARKPETKAKGTRIRRSEAEKLVPRKATKVERKRGPGRPRVKRDLPPGFALDMDAARASTSRKRKRRLDEDEDDNEEFHPAAAQHRATEGDADESGRGSEEPGSASRLRRRFTKYGDPDTPLKRIVLPPKTRGKRGGARPGSGRPRKHPLPLPKRPSTEGDTETVTDYTVSDSSSDPTEATEATEATEVTEATEAAAATAAGQGSSGSIPTAKPERMTTRSEKTQVLEIEDSDDAGENTALPGSGLRNDAGGTTQRDDEDEDEDVSVRVRQRTDRSSRVRRPPAKFRDDDMWN